jgi:hypothetical protein
MIPQIYMIQGLSQLGLGAINRYQSVRRAKKADAAYKSSLAEFRNQDTSNLAQNLQNPFEDLTVNQQQFQLQTEQQQQGLADITANLRGAAGSSGISAFAQSIANQQARNIQASAAQIGQQEARNQGFAAKGQMQIMGLELKGAERSRALETNLRTTNLAMDMNELAAANNAKQAAGAQIASGLGSTIAGGYQMYQNKYGDGTNETTLPEENAFISGTQPNTAQFYPSYPGGVGTSSGVMTAYSGSGRGGYYKPEYNAYGERIDPITGLIIE